MSWDKIPQLGKIGEVKRMDIPNQDERIERVPINKTAEDFETHMTDWEVDYLIDYLLHDTYAYQELIALMGEPGKALPANPDELSLTQTDILLDLAHSQTDWYAKWEAYSYEEFCNRREGGREEE